MQMRIKNPRGTWADNIEGLVMMGQWKEAAAETGLQISIECNDFAPILRPGDKIMVRKAADLEPGDLVMLMTDGQLRFLKVLKTSGPAGKVDLDCTRRGSLSVPAASLLGKVAELHRYGQRVEVGSMSLKAQFSRLFALLKRPV